MGVILYPSHIQDTGRMVTKYLVLALFLGAAMAQDQFDADQTELMENEARFLYFNSSSTATSLTLLGAVILLGVIFYLVYVGGLLSPASSGYAYNRNDYQYNQQYDNYARSAADGWNFDGLNVIRLICEVMQDSETFGNVSKRMSTGFEFAKYLEVMNMPDDFREILDEYLDASERSHGQKACSEVFQCPYSLRDSVKRNFSGNSL